MYQNIIADWRIIIFGFVLTFSTSPGQTFFISLFSESLQTDYSLTEGQFGLIYSAITLLSAFMLVFTGKWIDTLPLRRLVLCFTAALAVGCFIAAQAPTLWILIIGLFLMRHLGQGLINHAGAVVPVRYFPQDKSKALSFTSLGFSFGEAILPFIIVSLIGWLGWRSALINSGMFLLLIISPLIVWLLIGHQARHDRYLATLVEDNSQQTTSDAVISRRRSEVLRDYRFYLVLPALMSGPFFFTGYIIHQLFWLESLGWEMTWWAAWFVGFAIIKIATSLLMGPVVDYLTPARNLPLILLPLIIGFICLALFETRWAGALFLLMFGLNNAWTNLVNAPLWADSYGRKYLGSIKSMTSAIMVFSSALSPVLLGYLFDLGVSFKATLYGSLIILILSQLLVMKASKDYQVT